MTEKTKAQRVLKIIGTIIYAIVTIFLIVIFLTSYPVGDQNLAELGFAFTIIIFSLIALGVYSIPVALGIAGAIVSKKRSDKKSIVYFVIMIFLPLVTDALFFSTLFLLN